MGGLHKRAQVKRGGEKSVSLLIMKCIVCTAKYITHIHRARRLARVIILIVLGVPPLEAQSLDSLAQSYPSLRGYYEPRPITNREILRHQEEAQLDKGNLLPLLQEQRIHGTSTPSILAHQLSMPLVATYQTGARQGYYLPSPAESLPKITLFSQESSLLPVPKLPSVVSQQLRVATMRYLQDHHFDLFSYGYDALMEGRMALTQATSNADLSQMLGQKIENGRVKELAENITRQEIRLRYWVPAFETSIQLSQNYISDNWYKGGSSNLNLYTRTYLGMQYSKDKITWLNELENKLSLYTAEGSNKGSRYRISENLLRLRSNLGLKASKHWDYTIDAEARTQLFSTFNAARTVTQSALLSPLSTNIGVGMQYKYVSRRTNIYARRIAYSMNIAPFSYTMRVTGRKDIDLPRHGLTAEKPYYHRIGSTLRATLQWDFNMDISWTSRLYFNTSYQNVEAEWENTLVMRLGRYFSTRINVHLRFDDSVAALHDRGWRKHLQINELLSFGFNYKL